MLVVCLCCNANAQGGARASLETGANQFIGELLECFGYFSIAVASMEQSTEAKTAENKRLIKEHKAAASRALKFAFATGHQIGLTNDAVIARNKLVTEELQEKINHSMTNLTVLISKYQKPCKALIEKPMRRLKGLVNNGAANSSHPW